ncbi:MAG: hypothetical protein PHC61_00710 [Chitinivibrionales bacterium]|nr:hypothetical protein [Chitinivibrionales bacterium]
MNSVLKGLSIGVMGLLACWITVSGAPVAPVGGPIAQFQGPVQPVASSPQRLTLDVKNSDIQDVIRMISKGYNLNLILDKEVTGKVTVHLTDVPVLEGLHSIAESNGLEVVAEGNVYKIRKKSEEQKTLIRYIDGKLTVDIVNMDAKDFLKELSSKTAISIVPDNKVSGKISGKLYQVDFKDGITALLEGNGYKVSLRKNIYQVTTGDDAPAASPGMARPYMGSKTGRTDFYIDYSNGKLSLDISNGNLRDVIKAITDKSDIAIITYGAIDGEVNAKFEKIPLAEALELLLGGTRFTFVQKNNIIMIGERNNETPSGQALSKSELVPLLHTKADEVIKVLPKNIPAANVKVVKEQNALLVSGTSEIIADTRDFLNIVDIPTPQVRIDAVIVEFKDDLSKEFGLNASRNSQQTAYLSAPAPATQLGNSVSGFEVGGKIGDIKDIYKGVFGQVLNLGHLPDYFFIALRFLETQDKAKVLAQPSILTLNGYKASINVSETRYFTVTTGTAQDLTSRFQPISFGVKLDITPWISQIGQVTCDIAPEVSNSDGNSTAGYPNVSTRSLTTTVRINDGETLVLGGLIKNQDTQSSDRIPILGSIPIIGVLFRHTTTTHSKTNLVVYITPHILTSNSDSTLIKNAYEAFARENVPSLKQYFVRDKPKTILPQTEKIKADTNISVGHPADSLKGALPKSTKTSIDRL